MFGKKSVFWGNLYSPIYFVLQYNPDFCFNWRRKILNSQWFQWVVVVYDVRNVNYHGKCKETSFLWKCTAACVLFYRNACTGHPKLKVNMNGRLVHLLFQWTAREPKKNYLIFFLWFNCALPLAAAVSMTSTHCSIKDSASLSLLV